MTPEEMEDLDLDKVFGNPENPVRVVQPEAPVAPTPEAIAQPTQTAEPFLKTRTGTVYKNAEDAAQGIEHKDQLIARLRQEAIDRNGIDPITRQQVPAPAPTRKSYAEDSKSFIEDLSKAAQENNSDRYRDVQMQLINDTLAPFAPLLTSLVKHQAVEQASQKIPGIKDFIGSEEYSKTLDQFPMLKGAIAQSESNPQAQSQLEEFYQMSFQLANAGKVPEVVRAEAQSTPRPTVTSSTLPAAPTSSVSYTGQPGLSTPEGRKALIEQQERAGVLNFRM